MLEGARKCISFWYFRYLLVTELYMVEKWERVMFHILAVILLSLVSLFNWKVVLGFTRMLYEPSSAGFMKASIDFSIISAFLIAYMLICKKESR